MTAATPVQKLVLLSDLHLGQPGARTPDPEACLAAAFGQVAARHADAQAVIVLGDLSDRGGAGDYARLKAMIASSPVPVQLMLGNHDDRPRFRQVFGGAGPVQQTLRTADGTPCYLLDSHDPGRSGGSLAGGRRDWLEAELAAATQPGFVFLHHPPIRTFAPAFDAIGLDDRAGFAACLGRHPGKVRAVVFGHCHMPLAATVAGVPALCLPSLFQQSRPRFDAPVFEDDPQAPPGFGVLMFDRDAFALHRLTLPITAKEPPDALC
ncbi:metallophosphoesterase [Tropicimonas sp. IMCC34043]|uniref:metallophosphoesterase n=1 Tax=Tropicimonas sp. IMCC34043 TaxID=2248760 RepID=UPI000E26B89C|nr:metallophosphoesterase [Tropicimonas sp. IMCC34043]